MIDELLNLSVDQILEQIEELSLRDDTDRNTLQKIYDILVEKQYQIAKSSV